MPDLADLDLTSPLTLGVGWRRGSNLEAGRIELTQDVAERFRSICQAHTEALSGRTPKPYSPEADLEPGEEDDPASGDGEEAR